MTINWRLDETESIEPDTPLGRITIRGERGSISEDNLMLDTFFEALSDGLSALTESDTVSIDTIDEPDPLVLQRNGDGVRLTFGKQTAEVGSRASFHEELLDAIENFLSYLDSAARNLKQDPPEYGRLRKILARGRIEP